MSDEKLSVSERAARISHGLNVLGNLAAPHLLLRESPGEAERTERRAHLLCALGQFIEAALMPAWQEVRTLVEDVRARMAIWDGATAPPPEVVNAARRALAEAGVQPPREGWDAWQGPDDDDLDDVRSGIEAPNQERCVLLGRLHKVAARRAFNRWLADSGPGEVRRALLTEVERFLQVAPPSIDTAAGLNARQRYTAGLIARSRRVAEAMAPLLRAWPEDAAPDDALREKIIRAARDYQAIHTIFDEGDDEKESGASWHAWWDEREDV